jgi:hypothetical protein
VDVPSNALTHPWKSFHSLQQVVGFHTSSRRCFLDVHDPRNFFIPPIRGCMVSQSFCLCSEGSNLARGCIARSSPQLTCPVQKCVRTWQRSTGLQQWQSFWRQHRTYQQRTGTWGRSSTSCCQSHPNQKPLPLRDSRPL